ncbi:unnamed protein product [marine sediment metagenome]|uniref:Uncharacterized protein n=1 Tax=marine sediment metagenome TaxID=412755 RepID=X1A1Q2_9ZZZZ
MVACPFCGEDVPAEEYIEHYDKHVQEEIKLGKLMKEWKPVSVMARAPGLTPLIPVPPTPLETLYYINRDVQERQIKKSKWWIK